ncbi:MAG: AsmA family protein [Candidatus Binatia bacterium]
MKISRKAVAIILIVSGLAITIFLVSLNTLIEKNRTRIRGEIQQAIGRSVTFDELQLSLWGGLGLSAKNLRIAEDPRFAATPFIQTKELTMEVRWLPLLSGTVEIEKFILSEPEIQIIKNEAGDLNISALTGPKRKSKKSKKPKETAKKERRSAPIFLVSSVQLTHSEIHYIDRSLKEPVEIVIRNLDMDLHGLALTRTMKIKLAANLFAGQGQNTWLEGRIGPFLGRRTLTQYPMDLQVQMDPLLFIQISRTLPFLRANVPPYLDITGPLTFTARLRGTLAQPHISNLELSGPFFGSTTDNVTVRGELDFSKSTSWKEGEIRGKINTNPVSLNHLKKIPFLKQALPPSLTAEGPLNITSEFHGTAGHLQVHTLLNVGQSEIRYGSWLKKAKGIPADFDMKLVSQRDRLIVEESTLAIHNVKLKFSGLLQTVPDRRLKLRLRSDGMDISGWDRLLLPLSSYSLKGKLRWDISIQKNLSLSDGKLDIRGTANFDQFQAKDKKTGLGIEKMTSQLSFRGKQVHVENSSLRLGNTDLAFEATLPDLFQPILHYNLHSTAFNLADLPGLALGKENVMKAVRSTGELRIKKGHPRLQARLFSFEGTLQKIHYRNLSGDIEWTPGQLSFDNLSFHAMRGIFRANGTWKKDAKKTQRFTLNPNIEGMDLQALLSLKYPKFKDHIAGRLNFRARLWGEGQGGTALRQSLQGEGETLVREGSLKDFNLVKQVLSKVTGIPGLSNLLSLRIPLRDRAIFERKDTPFDTLEASFTVKQGQIHTNDLLIVTPEYSINGKGWVTFDKAVQWDARLAMSRVFTQDLIAEHRNVRYIADRQGRLTVPFRLTGTLPNVQAEPDLQGLTSAMSRGLLQKGMDRFLGEGEKRKKKDARDWLKRGLEQLSR